MEKLIRLFCLVGPAHAVYFGTYEAVKDLAGGNHDDRHHPFAAGTTKSRLQALCGRVDSGVERADDDFQHSAAHVRPFRAMRS